MRGKELLWRAINLIGLILLIYFLSDNVELGFNPPPDNPDTPEGSAGGGTR